MKKTLSIIAVLGFTIVGCQKEELPVRGHTPLLYVLQPDSHVISLDLGFTSDKICTNDYIAKFQINGRINAGTNYGDAKPEFTSTNKYSSSRIKLKCSDYLLRVNALLPNPNGGTTLIPGDEIQESITTDTNGNCEIKVKPGNYAGIIVSGSTDLIGKDPLSIGATIIANTTLRSFSLICP